MYAHPEFIGLRLSSDLVRKHYPLLCRSLGIVRPPPYKDFARELARLLPRKRSDQRPRDGKRNTSTWYWIPRPTTEVVALADNKRRKRA
jgi:hypothetical protein